MRTNATIASEQVKDSATRIAKVVIDADGSPVTYYCGDPTQSTRLLKRIDSHLEEPLTQEAIVVLDNSAQTFSAGGLSYKSVDISYGVAIYSGGSWTSYYSATARLWVMAEEGKSSEGLLEWYLHCRGVMFFLDNDYANDNYEGSDGDGYTCKDLIIEIIQTPSPSFCTVFDHSTERYTLSITDDAYIDTYAPEEGFKINRGGTRADALRRLLDYTESFIKVAAEQTITIWKVTETPVKTYQLGADNHNFFNRTQADVIILPNAFYVTSLDDAYSGNASAGGEAKEIRYYVKAKADSNQECTDIATALLYRAQKNSDTGRAIVQMDCLLEVGDYVTVTDSRSNNSRSGIVTSIKRIFNPDGRIDLEFGFGVHDAGFGLGGLLKTIEDETKTALSKLYVDELTAGQIDLVDFWNTASPDGTTFENVYSTHIDAHGVKIGSLTTYEANYNPSSKFDLAGNTLDDVVNGATYVKVRTTEITDGYIDLQGDIYLTKDGLYSLVGTTGVSIDFGGLSGRTGKIPISSISGNGTTVTVQTDGAHGFSTNDATAITGTTAYNTPFAIITVTDTDEFTYLDDPTGTENTGYAWQVQWACVNTDGKMYAANGNIIIDGSGIYIKDIDPSSTASLKLAISGQEGSSLGFIHACAGDTLTDEQDSLGDFALFPATGYVWIRGTAPSVIPELDNVGYLGTASYRWKEAHIASTYIDEFASDGDMFINVPWDDDDFNTHILSLFQELTNRVAVSGFADAGGGQITVTCPAHPFSNGDYVEFWSTDYDGVYQISNCTTNTFEITETYTDTETGSVWKVYKITAFALVEDNSPDPDEIQASCAGHPFHENEIIVISQYSDDYTGRHVVTSVATNQFNIWDTWSATAVAYAYSAYEGGLHFAVSTTYYVGKEDEVWSTAAIYSGDAFLELESYAGVMIYGCDLIPYNSASQDLGDVNNFTDGSSHIWDNIYMHEQLGFYSGSTRKCYLKMDIVDHTDLTIASTYGFISIEAAEHVAFYCDGVIMPSHAGNVTAVEAVIYYDTNDDKFHAYCNGAWYSLDMTAD